MRMRKRNSPDSQDQARLCVSAVSKDGVVVACLLRVFDSDNSAGEFDPFFVQRVKTAFDCTFGADDEQSEALLL